MTGRLTALRGVRARIALTLVALVALTAAVLGIGAYAFVDASLHQSLLTDGLRQAGFNVSVLAPADLEGDPSRERILESGLLDRFRLRGDVGTIVDLGDGDPLVAPAELLGALDRLPAELRTLVANGRLGYAWQTIADQPRLVVGGRMPSSGPDFYFVFDAEPIEAALATLRTALLVGSVILVGIALLTARAVSRGILRPVADAGEAADRIAAGDLAARVPVTSTDEFGAWAGRFNAMAETLEATIADLETAQAQNRRFVAEVSHELRTPLTALVAEASLLEGSLASIPPDARRPAELLVGDVRRLRDLVEDLMELSRFDAAAEQVVREPVELGGLVRAIVAARLPAASLDLPSDPVVVETDPRRLDRILGNLLDNARVHAPGAPVEVGLAADDAGGTRLWVSDRGPGVPAEALERIFGRFTKIDPARTGDGSGLGLAIVAEHAALLGGTVRAQPREGGGLRFEVRLPVAEPLRDGDGHVMPGSDAGEVTEPAPRPMP
jgi:two-component system sensor histidine kinase MtrB